MFQNEKPIAKNLMNKNSDDANAKNFISMNKSAVKHLIYYFHDDNRFKIQIIICD